jgi:DUF971 family protein
VSNVSLPAESVRPRGVTLDKQNHELRVDWGEGHVGVYPLNALREACPCVVCRGGHDMMGQEHDPNLIELKPARSYQVTEAQMVGNYAIQFWWDDGHNSGIYAWEYLYRICPCPDCEARRRNQK